LLRRYHPDSRNSSADTDADDDAAQENAAEMLGRIIEAYALLRDPGSRAAYDRRQEAPEATTSTSTAAGNHDFLIRAGPVRWHEERRSTSSLSRTAVTELEVMEELLRILRGRRLYW
jgi:DnaJ-class molecular chaperone